MRQTAADTELLSTVSWRQKAGAEMRRFAEAKGLQRGVRRGKW